MEYFLCLTRRNLCRGLYSLAVILFTFLCVQPTPTTAQELRILTSMPAAMFEPFAEAFEARNPDITVNVLNKNTNAGVEEIVRGNPRGFDIFWVSSAEAFAVLNAHDAFRTDENYTSDWRPTPRGNASFYPFALSSIGWAQLHTSSTPHPSEWDDLLRPEYVGKVAMTRPSRSGTTHMFVERFLQVRGWEGGWSYLLALSGNLSTLTSRSFGVIDGIEKQRFDVGITIDFLALARADDGLAFSYGKPVMVMPAQIGILSGGQSPDLAKAFVELVLSPEGQKILIRPDVRRIPIDAKLRADAGPAAQDIESALQLNWLPYDALLARDRYWAVNTLFDVFVTFQLKERQQAWRRLRKLQQSRDDDILSRLPEVEQLLSYMPVTETDAISQGVNDVPTRVTAFSAPTATQQDMLARWQADATATMKDVNVLLNGLEQMANQQE